MRTHCFRENRDAVAVAFSPLSLSLSLRRLGAEPRLDPTRLLSFGPVDRRSLSRPFILAPALANDGPHKVGGLVLRLTPEFDPFTVSYRIVPSFTAFALGGPFQFVLTVLFILQKYTSVQGTPDFLLVVLM